ncbi:serine/threonine protein kinase [Halotalea alkalilenta]|uniref:Stress response kinase A n=1 Tax=Halotalea alkalilenta TaxID=376489 RepID=A0A172YF12_9GAMM|nr:serine/threonine protein kinase [Halotalea alkalilenta]ANF57859.1 hypothetical protein A5892_10610 [Halotalea alkalilenta]
MPPDIRPPPFSTLDPMMIADAIESLGFSLGSEPFALNSYENRVVSFRDDDGGRWVAKFYRPGRWSNAAILDEHALLGRLETDGVPVGPLWRDAGGRSLFEFSDQRLAIFAQVPGRAPSLDDPAQLFALGEVIGRMHASAQSLELLHRPHFDAVSSCSASRETVLTSGRLRGRLATDYADISARLIESIESLRLPDAASILVHGDCHVGNLLGDGEHFALVDFDDCMYAPAVQDLWMLLGDDHEQGWRAQLEELVEGYEQYRSFDRAEIQWIELLRSVRLMRHAAWLLARWDDPAFPRAFPWVEGDGFWHDQLRALELQRVAIARKPWLA